MKPDRAAAKAVERELLEMQEKFAHTKGDEERAAIRRDYIDLHGRWVQMKGGTR